MEKAEERKVGPRRTCPACSSARVTEPVYCYPENRMFLGFAGIKKLFTGGDSVSCEKEGRHLHQKCSVCGCAWLCTPVEIKE